MIFRCSVVHVHESILIIYSTKTEFISTSGRSHSIWTLSRCGAKADLCQPVKTERSAGCGVLFVPAEPNVRNLWSRTTHLISATAFTKSNTKDMWDTSVQTLRFHLCVWTAAGCSWAWGRAFLISRVPVKMELFQSETHQCSCPPAESLLISLLWFGLLNFFNFLWRESGDKYFNQSSDEFKVKGAKRLSAFTYFIQDFF